MQTKKEQQVYLDQIEELERQLKKARYKIKKDTYGLHWLNIPEAFEDDVENKLPIIKRVEDKSIVNDDGKNTHILIEGDNYHALTCLNYTHKNKVDVIYIDPPYNTGSDNFIYKDKRILDRYPDGTPVPKESPFRHSYWLSFMNKRLLLAKELLKDDGVIFISIDENEHSQLKLLCDKIFKQENYLTSFIWKKKTTGGHDANDVNIVHEYILCYSKNISSSEGKILKKLASETEYPEFDEEGRNFKWDSLWTVSHGHTDNCDYPIEAEDGTKIHPWMCHRDGKKVKGKARWYWNKERFDEYKHLLKISNNRVYKRVYSGDIPIKSLFDTKNVGGTSEGKADLKKIFNNEDVFNNPKPVRLIKLLLERKCKDAIVLDFMAGSGTTGQAVLELNEKDGGSRQFILCTNNENNICDEVTYERMKRVICGYDFTGKDKKSLYKKKITYRSLKNVSIFLAKVDEIIKSNKSNKSEYDEIEKVFKNNTLEVFGVNENKGYKEGLGGSLKYYKTAFIGNNNILHVNDTDRTELAYHAGEMLAISENTLYEINEYRTSHYQLFHNNEEKYTAIYFREELEQFEQFHQLIIRLNHPVIVYVFSWTVGEFLNQFDSVSNVEIKAIPQPILAAYEKNNQILR
jgi:adenine specific DNA methylase Mod